MSPSARELLLASHACETASFITLDESEASPGTPQGQTSLECAHVLV
jgi:hypothetical protein